MSDGLGVITLNRAEVRNALDLALAEALGDAARLCRDTAGVRAVLINGRGPVFSVGGDLSVLAGALGGGPAGPGGSAGGAPAGGPAAGALPGLLRRMTGAFNQAVLVLSSLEVPVVAAVRGAVAGGGLGLICLADFVLAAEGTRFAPGFGALGLPGDGGTSWFLPRIVGQRRAAAFYYDGRVLDAAEAQDWGLVSRVVPDAALDADAEVLARRLAHGPTVAFGEMRRLLQGAWSLSLAEQLEAEVSAMERSAWSKDAAAGITGFARRVAPVFEGS